MITGNATKVVPQRKGYKVIIDGVVCERHFLSRQRIKQYTRHLSNALAHCLTDDAYQTQLRRYT